MSIARPVAAERDKGNRRRGHGARLDLIRTIRLQVARAPVVSDLLPTASGRFWIADAAAGRIEVYAQDGRRVRALGRDATRLARPVALAALHGRWIVALDGGRPRISILDEAARLQRIFVLPEVDRAYGLCALGDRMLAVAGAGWGAGRGRLVHLYTPGGKHIESLFTAPRGPGAPIRVAGSRDLLCVGGSQRDSFVIHHLDGATVRAFTSVATRLRAHLRENAPSHEILEGLFVTDRRALLAVYGPARRDDHTARPSAPGYLYDVYSLGGRPVALGLRARERIVAVEGALYFSVQEIGRGLRIRVRRYGRGRVTGRTAP